MTLRVINGVLVCSEEQDDSTKPTQAMLLLIIIVTTALFVSFTCSVLEASLLSARLVNLRQRAQKGELGAKRLLDIKQNRLDDGISAILTYNTIAHTVGATLAGAQAAHVFGDNWVGFFSAVLTFLILIITEIIPKTIGAVYAEQLARPVGLVIELMLLPPMKWVLYLTRSLTRLIVRGKHRLYTRADLLASVDLAAKEGAIEHEESRMFTQMLRATGITVGDVMTPGSVLSMLPDDITIAEALLQPERRNFSRLPVYQEQPNKVIGYVLVRDLLERGQSQEGANQKIADFVRPLPTVMETLSVAEALKLFTQENEHMAIVDDEFGMISGLVTMEDLIETALGVEIVDELDEAVNLRQVARELREKRLGRKQASLSSEKLS